MASNIISVVTIPHSGTQSIVKAIDPVGFERLRKLAENGELTEKSFRESEFNYIMLEDLSCGWLEFKSSGKSLLDHNLIDRNRKNLIHGHFVCNNNRSTYKEALSCIEELHEHSRIIMSMRDPLLTLISSSMRTQNKRIVKGSASLSDLGGPLAPLSIWMRNRDGWLDRERHKEIEEDLLILPKEDYAIVAEIAKNYSLNLYPEDVVEQFILNRDINILKQYRKPSTQNISGTNFYRDESEPTIKPKKPISDYLNILGKRGAKKPIPGSEHINAGSNEMRGFLFMWELWAKHIHKLNPHYIYMDKDNLKEKFEDIGIYNLEKHNVSKSLPLKKAYYNKDLLYIATELNSNLKALIDMESILRPPLEELGYENLLWWDTGL